MRCGRAGASCKSAFAPSRRAFAWPHSPRPKRRGVCGGCGVEARAHLHSLAARQVSLPLRREPAPVRVEVDQERERARGIVSGSRFVVEISSSMQRSPERRRRRSMLGSALVSARCRAAPRSAGADASSPGAPSRLRCAARRMDAVAAARAWAAQMQHAATLLCSTQAHALLQPAAAPPWCVGQHHTRAVLRIRSAGAASVPLLCLAASRTRAHQHLHLGSARRRPPPCAVGGRKAGGAESGTLRQPARATAL